MSPQSVGARVRRDAPSLRTDDSVQTAVQRLLDSELPALPAVDRRGRFAGIFGEREFMAALFPGYLQQLKYAGFVSASLDDALEKRDGCRAESVCGYLNTEHIDVTPDFSDLQIAETFLHHRVLIIPIVDHGELLGVITRGDFFRHLAERFIQPE